MKQVNEIINKLKNNKQVAITISAIVLFVILSAGITYAAFNYTSDNATNNVINSGMISMSYIEPSNEYVVANALPVKDEEAMYSSNYFEFSITTKVPTNENDDVGVTIPYEITISESEGNTLTADQIKMYVTEVERDTEIANIIPTKVSALETSLFTGEGTKVGFNIHLHRNGNETITKKYRLRAWIDSSVDASDWNTSNKYQYKFRVNVNGEATYQGYSSDPKCFTYEKNNNGNYTITGFNSNECSSKNIAIPVAIPETTSTTFKEIKAINWISNDEFKEIYKELMLGEGFCSNDINTDEDWANCLNENGMTEDDFYAEGIAMYEDIKAQYQFEGENYYDHKSELSDYDNLLFTVELGEDETKDTTTYVKVDTISSFALSTIGLANEDKNGKVNDLTNIVGENKAAKMADETPYVNGLIIPNDVTISGTPFTAVEINKLIDRTGEFPSQCFESSNGAITGYKCEGVKNIRISSEIDGVKITKIEYGALSGKRLTAVEIPSGVEEIANYAFSGNKLIDVILPNTLKTIGESAFDGNKLTTIILPEDLETIKMYAFANNNLSNIKFGNNVKLIGNFAFQNNSLTSLELPNNGVSVGEEAFINNKLETVILPDSVNLLSNGTFRNNTIKTLTNENGQFSKACLNYTSDGNGVTLNGYKCWGAINFDIPKEIDNLPVVAIGEEAFKPNSSFGIGIKLNKITIPESVKTIGINAFSGNNLKSLVIPNNGIRINNAAFSANKITSVVLPDSVKLNSEIFEGNEITKIVNENGSFPSSCFSYSSSSTSTTIQNYYCDGVVNVVIPSTLNNLPVTELRGFSYGDFKTVKIPNTVEKIDDEAFEENKRLESIVIPNSVRTIGISAFANCGLKNVTLGEGLETIWNNAFYKNNLTTVTIPKNVKTIGDGAFYKTNGSNIKLTKIINTTGKPFPWGYIINDKSGLGSFETGTVENDLGNVEITLN